MDGFKKPLCLMFLALLFVASVHCEARRGGGRRREEGNPTLNGGETAAEGQESSNQREGKLFSLFSLVSFRNSECQSTEDDDEEVFGTCFTSEECEDKGGRAEGNCAAGFGVCCVFVEDECGGTVDKNGTYVQNAGYPRGNNTLQLCKFDFKRIANDICQIRLDFDRFEITGPSNVIGDCATSGDQLIVTSPTGNNAPSNLCGTLTGQHMYLETGDGDDAGSMTIDTKVESTPRVFSVRVSFLSCSSPSRAPEGCLQYFTGAAGTFSTYGHNNGDGVQPTGQRYSFCFRREQGFCSYQIQESSVPRAFDLGRAMAAAVTTACSETSDPNAGGNYIRVQLADATGEDLRCGSVLSNAINDETPGVITSSRGAGPFVVDYFLTEISDPNATLPLTEPLGAGFSLEYAQIPC